MSGCKNEKCKCTTKGGRALKERVDCKCVDCKCKCPCPPDCKEKMKKMYRYLKDTEKFLRACDKCPLAVRLLESCDEILVDFSCPVN